MNIPTAMIAALTVYLLPFFTGRFLLRAAQKSMSVVGTFAVGALAVYAVILTGAFWHITIPASALRTIGVLFAIGIAALNVDLLFAKMPITKSATIAAIIGLIAFAIWKYTIPYPLTVNWDAFEHQTLINNLLTGHIAFETVAISDTFGFNGYSTIFHVLLAIPQFLFGPDVLGFWWFTEGVHFIITLAATYLLAKAVTKNQTIAVVASIFSAFVFESYSVYSSFFLIPQTMVAAAFALTLPRMLREDTKILSMETLAIFVFLVLTHYIFGAAAILVLVFTWVIGKLHLAEKPWFTIVTIAATFALFTLLGLAGRFLPVSLINSGEAAAFIYPLTQKIEFFRVFYGWSFFILTPIGLLIALRSKQPTEKIIAALSLLILAVVASPFPYAIKFYVMGRYTVHIVMAIAVGGLLTCLTPITKKIVLTILILFAAILLTLNAGYWKHDLLYTNTATEVSKNEIAAVQFLKNQYSNQPVLLVSDPATQNVLEALSGINSDGGAYMTVQNRQFLYDTLRDSTTIPLPKLAKIHDGLIREPIHTYILAFSGRTFTWLASSAANRESLGYNVWVPQDLTLTDETYLQSLSAGKLVYKNSGIAIYEVNL
jgi:hypothetical protein